MAVKLRAVREVAVRIPFVPSVKGVVGGGLHWRQPLAVPVVRTPAAFDAPAALENGAYCTPLEDQGQNPWCAAYALCCILQASAWRHYGHQTQFDEAMLYAAAKEIDGIKVDGTTLEAVVSVARTSDLTAGKLPLPAISAHYVEDAEEIPYAIHRYGLVLAGMSITEGWVYPWQNGWVSEAGKRLGGHAVVVSGYNRVSDYVRGPNSWGPKWGVAGHWVMRSGLFRDQYLGGYGIQITWPQEAA